MEEKKVSIAMCVSVSHTLPGAFFNHYMNFFLYNSKKYDLLHLCEVHYITDYARNRMVNKIMKWKNKPDYVFFIDSDMVFEPNILDKLIEADKDIITGLYFQKHKPHYPLAWVVREFDEVSVNGENGSPVKNKCNKYCWDTEFKFGEVQEIAGCGAGALLVKTKVLEEMKSPWFKFLIDDNGCPVGEDIYFCKKAIDKGFKIWLHAGTIINHIGNSSVDKRDFDACKNLKEIEKFSPTGLHPGSFKTEDKFMQ